MSAVVSLSSREAEPVLFGNFTLWCEGFRAEAVRVFSETGTVDGEGIITGSYPKSMKLTFSGRICDEDEPLDFVRSMSELTASGESFSVLYRGTTFTDCVVQSFKAEDKGEEHIYASLSVLTSGIDDEVNDES